MTGRRIWRHEVVRAINRIVDANSFDDLLCGSEEESVKLCTVLLDLAAGAPRHGRAADAVARRRGLSTRYIEDRAKVLLGYARGGGRQDAYTILGLPPLSSLERIRERWRDLARELHPDSRGGDEGVHRFLAVKQAYDTLSDPAKRCAYDERRRRAISVLEAARVALDESAGEPLWRRWWGGGKGTLRQRAAQETKRSEAAGDPRWAEVADRLTTLVRRWKEMEARVSLGSGASKVRAFPVSELLDAAARLERAVGTCTVGELDAAADRIGTLLPLLKQARQGLETLQELKRVIRG